MQWVDLHFKHSHPKAKTICILKLNRIIEHVIKYPNKRCVRNDSLFHLIKGNGECLVLTLGTRNRLFPDDLRGLDGSLCSRSSGMYLCIYILYVLTFNHSSFAPKTTPVLSLCNSNRWIVQCTLLGLYWDPSPLVIRLCKSVFRLHNYGNLFRCFP